MQNFKLFFRALLLVFILTMVNCTKVSSSDYYVESVSEPIISLNGDWKISLTPGNEFWKDSILNDTWKDIKVPGEVMMQGFSIKNDIAFAYKKEIDIPLDFEGKNVFLRFDGVYSYARVWVNGNFVRDHFGGFTRWKCDITPFVTAGEKARVTIEVTDRSDDISYASGYAKHQIAGILRDVNLMALPKIYPHKINIETDLDTDYKNVNLIISGELNSKPNNSSLQFKLFDENQKEIELNNATFNFTDTATFKSENNVINPKKWDAEHPNLYTLQVIYMENNEIQWSEKQKIGFREIEIVDNIMLVNGKSVKLRGACRHDIHPTLGRVSTPEYELKDVLLTKEANMNFIRTSHYPPSDNFLKLCDEYGIYVEDETAVCFVNEYRMTVYAFSNLQNDLAFTDRYLSQLEEMVDGHRNHPSVVIWSIGNENHFGTNFEKSYKWVKQNDKTRPVMFSYPGTAADSIMPYEILSMHYPSYKGGDKVQFNKKTKNFGFKEMPVIFDEWAHVACYNNETILEDPNIRNFWGQSLDKMWAKTFDADGGLGGAIWGMIDETFMLPKDLAGFRDWWGINDKSVLPYKGTTIGYGEWGIIDVWRRKKPEFWNTKKAYSPIKILNTTIENYKRGNEIKIPVYNRFDHTNLNEIKVKYTYKEKTETLKSFDLEPHKKGNFKLPINNWDTTEKVAIHFYDSKENLIDSYNIKQAEIKENITNMILSKEGGIDVIDENNILKIVTNVGDLIIDKNTGLFKEIRKGDKKTTFNGPYFVYKTKGKGITYSSNFINDFSDNWKLKKILHSKNENEVIVQLKGKYNKIKVSFELHITKEGKITTLYEYEKLPKEYLREIGVKYVFEPMFDALEWNRVSYWSVYPDNHMSAISGKVPLYTKELKTYRAKPSKTWEQDTKSFYYNGTDDETYDELTYVAAATKEKVLEYSLLKDSKKLVTVIGDGKISCRISKYNNQLNLFLINQLDYVDLSWGNYQRNIMLDGRYTGEIEFKITPFNN